MDPFRVGTNRLPVCTMSLNRFVVVVVVVYFILTRLLYLAFSANLGLLCIPVLCRTVPLNLFIHEQFQTAASLSIH